MSLNPLVGHDAAIRQLGTAWASGRLPQALLIEGPSGSGRQRVGLWLAQLMFCESAKEKGALGTAPCGTCRGCRLVAELSHPDFHWIVPVPRPKGGSDQDKQVDEVAEALGEVMAERRKQPLYGPPDGLAIHGVATVRLIQRRAALRSVEGGPRVFLIGHAERLVPQESSPEAANALLKLLEEPPPGCWFILTAAEARRLLPTIRSRVVPQRLSRVPDAAVRSFGREVLGLEGKALDTMVRTAEGAIGRVVGEVTGAGKAADLAASWLAAAGAGPLERAERALKQGTWAARGEFTEALSATEELLRDRARDATSDARRREAVEAMGHVAAAREAAQGNVNPQLLLANLLEQLVGAAGNRGAGSRGMDD